MFQAGPQVILEPRGGVIADEPAFTKALRDIIGLSDFKRQTRAANDAVRDPGGYLGARQRQIDQAIGRIEREAMRYYIRLHHIEDLSEQECQARTIEYAKGLAALEFKDVELSHPTGFVDPVVGRITYQNDAGRRGQGGPAHIWNGGPSKDFVNPIKMTTTMSHGPAVRKKKGKKP
jgi:hypothetical protein